MVLDSNVSFLRAREIEGSPSWPSKSLIGCLHRYLLLLKSVRSCRTQTVPCAALAKAICIRLPQSREQHISVSYFSSWLVHHLAEICIWKLICNHLGFRPSQHPKILHNSLTHSSYREVLSTLFQPNSAWYAWLQSTVPWQDLHKTWPHYSLHT